MNHQQGIRRRFSNILTSSIGICRTKSPIYINPISATSIPTNVQKPRPRLSDLFSADSDTTHSSSGSEADRASSMSNLISPYETCVDDTDESRPIDRQDVNKNMLTFHMISNASESEDVVKRTSFHLNNYYTSDTDDIASAVLIDQPEYQTKNQKCISKHRRRRRRSEDVSRSSVAVAKRSVDPYEDFKKSMVEMIVEKEMFGREELEELLLSFLSLNSPEHHKIIVLVFVDILRILFSNVSE